jgi:hemerythrin superfamily protein
MAAKKRNSRTSAKRKTSARSGQGRAGDAIALLKADHAKVKDLIKQFEGARSDSQKNKLAQQICQELTVHTALEEEIFYPAVREALSEEDLVDEAEVEHQSAKELISQIEDGQEGDDKWEAKVTVLGEYINHHVEEEEKEMFPKIRKAELDLKELALQLQTRKQELLAQQ